jgi:hypothetical protein
MLILTRKVMQRGDRMDDLISRQAAIDTVDEALTRVFVEHRDIAEKMINKIPSAQPEPHYDEWCTDCKEYNHERHCCPRWNKVIRQTLKDAQPNTDHIYAELSKVYNVKGLPDAAIGIIGDLMLSLDGPSAQPERLTDDDFETIRIHLNAYKEKLCNQQRWEEAEEYEQLIARFMVFASVQQEIIRCKDCKFYTPMNRETKTGICRLLMHQNFGDDWYCAGAERRTDD